MKHYSISFLSRVTSCVTALVLLLTAVLPSSFAQEQTQSESAINLSAITDQSRAEQEAEQMVSLSAENIIAILQKEPGLASRS